MPYIPTECKFGFLTDTHFSVVRNNFRTDSFFDSVISKFSQCYDHFNATGCEFIVHGGDMFDKYRSYSHPMILKIREVIVNSKIPTYFIWGQHDLLGYNRDSSRNSNLEFLKEICDGNLKELNDHVDTGFLHLYASHVDQDPAEVFQFRNKCAQNIGHNSDTITTVQYILFWRIVKMFKNSLHKRVIIKKPSGIIFPDIGIPIFEVIASPHF